MAFVDEAVVRVAGGNGGRGCIAFRREKFVPRGGPSGGDGGHGGSVYLVGDRNLNTLHHLRFQPRFEAERGRHGEGSNKTGRSGGDLEVRVPLGTIVRDRGTEEVLGEVLEDDERLLVAQGGRGGLGNAHFKTATHRAPRRAQPGEEGQERELALELKLLADVGLVGLPNAGKSTLISRLSAARPRIADYPFTTLQPQLGVVAEGPLADPFVIADLPGLIEGAAEGAGLGHQFLRHVERCRVLVHLVDLSALESEDALPDLLAIEDELVAFDPALGERPRLLVGSKVDAVREERLASLEAAAAERGLELQRISAVTGEGLDDLRRRMREMLAASREAESTEVGDSP